MGNALLKAIFATARFSVVSMTRFPDWRLDGGPRDRAGSRFLLATGGEKLAADGLEEVTSPKAD